jgi:hypothetical protein
MQTLKQLPVRSNDSYAASSFLRILAPRLAQQNEANMSRGNPLQRSRCVWLASMEINALLTGAGLDTISFEITFLTQGAMRVTLFNDEKPDEISDKDALTIRTLASIFSRTAIKYDLVYEPGAKFEWNLERAS